MIFESCNNFTWALRINIPKRIKETNDTICLIILFVVFLSITPQTIFSQSSTKKTPRFKISGIVYDKKTKEPLPYVNVFLDNTTKGCASDANGQFVIEGVPVGEYLLIVSMIGYKMDTYAIKITNQDLNLKTIPMKSEIIKGELVQITAKKPYKWRSDLRKFKVLFLGTSFNAVRCKILNPEVLKFNTNKVLGRFSATSEIPLQIVNHALGYKIEFHLIDFLSIDEGITRYQGRTKFKLMVPKNQKEDAKWKRNRRKTYIGSFRHFLKAMYDNNLRKEDFDLYAIKELGNPKKHAPVERDSVVIADTLFAEKVLTYNYYLKIIDNYDQTSYLEFDKYNPLIIDSEGRPSNAYDVIKYGYWGDMRFADELPLDYSPQL